MHPNFRVIVPGKEAECQRALDEIGVAGGGVCVILPGATRGKIFDAVPSNVAVIDLRYEGGFHLLRGNHPRKEGLWTQYAHLTTGLARNVVISDSIDDQTKVETWESKEQDMQPAPQGGLTSETYKHQHNHYQNFLSEVYNFSAHLNGVAIWGDSGAFAPGAKSWGGFFSARSWPVRWQGYTPSRLDYREDEFDAALVGIEIDVLNAGRDALDRAPQFDDSLAKIGVQIVGFGKRNTAAIEVRTEDSDDASRDASSRRGAWHWGIIIRGALHDKSTVLYAENGVVHRGVDLWQTVCRDGALLIAGQGRHTGVRFDPAFGGEVYQEKDGTLVVEGGSGGVRMQTAGGDFLGIQADGTIQMSEKVRDSLARALKHAGKERA